MSGERPASSQVGEEAVEAVFRLLYNRAPRRWDRPPCRVVKSDQMLIDGIEERLEAAAPAIEARALAEFEERLLAYADELEGMTLEGDGPADLTAATVRAVKAQGVRDAIDHTKATHDVKEQDQCQ